jgi:hypothetical protein
MDNHWAEFRRRVAAWRQPDDADRFKMVELYSEAHRYRETNPEYQFEILTRGRAEAQRLNEPWWVLFFDGWRLMTLTADLHDFARGLPLAMELLVRFNAPENRTHPQRVVALIDALYCHLHIDPVGYKDELERGFAHLDGQVSKEPISDRFVLDYRRTEYLCEAERWQEAHDLAQESLARVERCAEAGTRTWHGAWCLFLLCEICHALGELDQVAGYAEDLAERSEKYPQLRRTQAAAFLWLAVTRRANGDERNAARSFQRGMTYLEGLAARDEICAEAVAKYYELGGDFNLAVAVRDRQLTALSKQGMLNRACRVHVERCRLLARAGSLTAADIIAARQAAGKLRSPGPYLERIARIEAS